MEAQAQLFKLPWLDRCSRRIGFLGSNRNRSVFRTAQYTFDEFVINVLVIGNKMEFGKFEIY